MADTDFDPDVLSQVPGEGPDARIIRAALVGVGASASKNIEVFKRTVVRPSDRTPEKLPYYLNDKELSTCQLAQMAWVRMAGAPYFVAPYVMGAASGEQDAAYNAHDAMLTVGPGWALDLSASDGFWIDNGSGTDLHAVTTIADPIKVNDTTYTVETVEGGQADFIGSTMTGQFTRTLTLKDGRWYMGSRFIIRVLKSTLLPIPWTPAPTQPPEPTDDGSASTDPAA